MQSETLAQEFARLVKEYHEGDDRTKPEAWNLLADYAVDNADAISAALSDKQAGEVSCIACEGRPSAGNNPCAVCGRSALVAVPAVEPTIPTANCCVCGRIIDTREKWEGGDDFGDETEAGKWTCSVQCYDAYVGFVPDEPAPLREGEDSAGRIPGATAAFRAIDVADRLIQSAYGDEVPSEWNKAFRSVAKARGRASALAATRSGSATTAQGCAE